MLRINELLEATGGKLINRLEGKDIKGISIDSRSIKPQEAFIAIKGTNFDGHDFIHEAVKKGAGAVIVHGSQFPPQADQPTAGTVHSEKRVSVIRVKDTTKALGDIARFWRKKFLHIPVIAVTGSNGKTTTKEMVGCLLSKKFRVLKNEGTKNNHIGLPMALLGLNNSHDIVVLEIGTNHFGEVDYLTRICRPNIGIITNIGPSHLEYLRNLERVFREKYSLIENLEKPCVAILNADDALLRKKVLSRVQKPFIIGFSLKKQSDFRALDIQSIGRSLRFSIQGKYRFTLKTLGYYNVYNALSAIITARLFGIAYNDIAPLLADFNFPPGRLKFIEIKSIRFIDDTYNSNPLSLKQALDALKSFKAKGRKIFVMGDMLELGSRADTFHYQAGEEAAKCCDIFITAGKLSRAAARAARDSGLNKKNIFISESAVCARDILYKRVSLNRDDIVLVKGSRSMKMEEVFKA
ncbi:MAG: UDP-N-acetylmuramoyl-tripeptide--D-alanyl-D-alanine ligase [Candidatus Omnitrophica bacterium]|nr:UDP-N-acetylmuramoyl-tripeptide--D-alanyl-D-alanine ligase [Candidatus Omnitrophota bacterium]MDD5592310.1 UDP-N-acetylmuramoyl-tripeptide--D-alanyl-D-alanine ligase [Candidatus Omnitrophota bacterium]